MVRMMALEGNTIMAKLDYLAKMDLSFEELQILCRALRIYKTRLKALMEAVHDLYGDKGTEIFKHRTEAVGQLISRADRARASVEP